MKRNRNCQRAGWEILRRVLFTAFAVMALSVGPGSLRNANANIESDLEAKIDTEGLGFEAAAEVIMRERLTAGESYEDVLEGLISAAEAIATKHGRDVSEAVAAVRAGAERVGQNREAKQLR